MIYAGQHEKYLDIAGYLSKLYTTFSKKRDFTEDISLQTIKKNSLCKKSHISFRFLPSMPTCIKRSHVAFEIISYKGILLARGHVGCWRGGIFGRLPLENFKNIWKCRMYVTLSLLSLNTFSVGSTMTCGMTLSNNT